MTTTTQNHLTSIPDDIDPAVLAVLLKSLAKGWWWDKTHNPFRGCRKTSPGCVNCWALIDIIQRLQHRTGGVYDGLTGPTFYPDELAAYARDLQPKRYFTPSMSDPFLDDFSDEQIFAFFEAIAAAPWHYYFTLTKRSERLAQLGPYLPWGEHVIAVVSVEDEKRMRRIADLQQCGAARKGVSFEPVVGRVPLRDNRDLVRGLDYAIVGGETADRDKVRPMKIEHAREIVEVCLEENVPVMFKQIGDVDFEGNYVGRKKAGRQLDSRTYDALPLGCADHLNRGVTLAEIERMRRRSR